MPLSHADYTIGWICAIDVELDVAKAALDHRHNERPPSIPGDDNLYTFGSIGPHNIVVASLPSGSYGTNAAAIAARDMKRSFHNLRFGLMVGVGGGVPKITQDCSTTRDIRLGDVVVSNPIGTSSGVIQYDMGKQEEEEPWLKQVGTLNMPPRVLRNGVRELRSQYRFEQRSHNNTVAKLIHEHGFLTPDYVYQGAENDVLFDTQARHMVSNVSCDECDKNAEISRPDRNGGPSIVHYGVIASGNQVVKDSVTRDHWRDVESVLCFEMEAAGLMNDFPCLVIRGICDYADSHKNKRWQPYAALAAAAYAKDLLLEIQPESVEATERAFGEHDGRKTNYHWSIPRTSSSSFVGRAEIANELSQAFDEKRFVDRPAFQRRFVIAGLGGTGKSEVAIKFAEAHRQEFWGIFWINVGDATSSKRAGAQSTVADGFDVVPTPSAEQEYLKIGKLCGLAEPSFDAVKTWLANTAHRWLLIVDNADNPKIKYRDYFPSGDRGNIIFTTRNPECASYATVGSIELTNLGMYHACELLLASAGVTRELWSEQERAARVVVKALGSHTLAVIQAGVIIRKKLCKMSEFSQTFMKKKADLLRWRMPQIESTYESVFATFEISIRYLDPAEKAAADALELLGILTFMHFAAVQEEIFHRASGFALLVELQDEDEDINDVSRLSHLHRVILPEWMKHEADDGMDSFRFRTACSMLMSLGIIKIDDEENNMHISMHPLMHEWLQIRQDVSSRRTSWKLASSILALSTWGAPAFKTFFRTLNPHIHALLPAHVENFVQEASDTCIWQALFLLSYVLMELQDVRLLTRSVSLLTKRRDSIAGLADWSSQVDYLEAHCLIQQGKYKAAEKVLERTVAIKEKSFNEDQHPLLASQQLLASTYVFNGQNKKAIEILEKVVTIREKSLNEDHPRRLASQHELARAYMADRQHERAAKILEKVVAIKQESLDEDHPSRLKSQELLAGAYMDDGQYERAIGILEKVLAMREKSLNEDHPDRLASQLILFEAYKQLLTKFCKLD